MTSIILMDHTTTTTTTTTTFPAKAASKKAGKRTTKSGDSMKVVYISSPMKVTTSASRFRSLVQQLTGKNSDIARYMDVDGGGAATFRDQDGMLLRDNGRLLSSGSNSDDTTTTPATSDNSFLVEDHHFSGLFSPESFCADDYPHSQMDVLGSYNDLLM